MQCVWWRQCTERENTEHRAAMQLPSSQQDQAEPWGCPDAPASCHLGHCCSPTSWNLALPVVKASHM